jgi:hypothetical protein
VSSDKWSLGWGWLAWLGLSAHTLYFRCFGSVELTTDHTYLDTIVTILLSLVDPIVMSPWLYIYSLIRFLCRSSQDRRRRRKEKKLFLFRVFCDRLSAWLLSELSEEKRKEKEKKRCRLRRSISIERVDQSRMRVMRVWLKMFLKKENCRNQRLAREKQRLSRRRSYSSDFRRQSHRYKLCRCYFVDWSSCLRQRFRERLFSTNTTLLSFLIDTLICVRIMISKKKRKFVVCFVTAIL